MENKMNFTRSKITAVCVLLSFGIQHVYAVEMVGPLLKSDLYTGTPGFIGIWYRNASPYDLKLVSKTGASGNDLISNLILKRRHDNFTPASFNSDNINQINKLRFDSDGKEKQVTYCMESSEVSACFELKSTTQSGWYYDPFLQQYDYFSILMDTVGDWVSFGAALAVTIGYQVYQLKVATEKEITNQMDSKLSDSNPNFAKIPIIGEALEVEYTKRLDQMAFDVSDDLFENLKKTTKGIDFLSDATKRIEMQHDIQKFFRNVATLSPRKYDNNYYLLYDRFDKDFAKGGAMYELFEGTYKSIFIEYTDFIERYKDINTKFNTYASNYQKYQNQINDFATRLDDIVNKYKFGPDDFKNVDAVKWKMQELTPQLKEIEDSISNFNKQLDTLNKGLFAACTKTADMSHTFCFNAFSADVIPSSYEEILGKQGFVPIIKNKHELIKTNLEKIKSASHVLNSGADLSQKSSAWKSLTIATLDVEKSMGEVAEHLSLEANLKNVDSVLTKGDPYLTHYYDATKANAQVSSAKIKKFDGDVLYANSSKMNSQMKEKSGVVQAEMNKIKQRHTELDASLKKGDVSNSTSNLRTLERELNEAKNKVNGTVYEQEFDKLYAEISNQNKELSSTIIEAHKNPKYSFDDINYQNAVKNYDDFKKFTNFNGNMDDFMRNGNFNVGEHLKGQETLVAKYRYPVEGLQTNKILSVDDVIQLKNATLTKGYYFKSFMKDAAVSTPISVAMSGLVGTITSAINGSKGAVFNRWQNLSARIYSNYGPAKVVTITDKSSIYSGYIEYNAKVKPAAVNFDMELKSGPWNPSSSDGNDDYRGEIDSHVSKLATRSAAFAVSVAHTPAEENMLGMEETLGFYNRNTALLHNSMSVLINNERRAPNPNQSLLNSYQKIFDNSYPVQPNHKLSHSSTYHLSNKTGALGDPSLTIDPSDNRPFGIILHSGEVAKVQLSSPLSTGYYSQIGAFERLSMIDSKDPRKTYRPALNIQDVNNIQLIDQHKYAPFPGKRLSPVQAYVSDYNAKLTQHPNSRSIYRETSSLDLNVVANAALTAKDVYEGVLYIGDGASYLDAIPLYVNEDNTLSTRLISIYQNAVDTSKIRFYNISKDHKYSSFSVKILHLNKRTNKVEDLAEKKKTVFIAKRGCLTSTVNPGQACNIELVNLKKIFGLQDCPNGCEVVISAQDADSKQSQFRIVNSVVLSFQELMGGGGAAKASSSVLTTGNSLDGYGSDYNEPKYQRLLQAGSHPWFNKNEVDTIMNQGAPSQGAASVSNAKINKAALKSPF